MEMIFRAYDGMEFKTARECSVYEASKSKSFNMYSDKSKTSDPSDTFVLELLNNNAAYEFMSLCIGCDMNWCKNGIDVGKTGLYLWSFDDGKFIQLTESMIAALKLYFKENSEE